MTEEELKSEAKKLGYNISKKPIYQCSCYMPYPNINHKKKNGKWKCVDKYIEVEINRKWHKILTYCKRIDEGEKNG